MPELINKLLIKIVLFTLFLVLICQTIIYYDPFHLQISLIDKLEGEPILFQEVNPVGDVVLNMKYVTLKIMNPYITSLPEAKIFCNEKQVGDFTNLQFTVIVEIGDRLTIDASKYSLDLLIKAVPSKDIKIPYELIHIKKEGKTTIFIESEG